MYVTLADYSVILLLLPVYICNSRPNKYDIKWTALYCEHNNHLENYVRK